ncbi:hypothetical protein [Stutzerimonas nitrititolerans]|uniref:hypothetical protein n=1 Tax=Stutzerimonas nitrititolerans TaxID=2482751 RepID=UPI0028AE6B0D|nr:hypothetical protein [Stutzerimonas nitrititolerans]
MKRSTIPMPPKMHEPSGLFSMDRLYIEGVLAIEAALAPIKRLGNNPQYQDDILLILK